MGVAFAAAFIGIASGSQQGGVHRHGRPGLGLVVRRAAPPVTGGRTVKFRTTLFQSGKSAVGIRVPSELVDGLGAGKRPPVRVTINGYTYRNTIAVMGGVFMVGVSGEHRAKAHVAGGDEVEVDIELDTQPRVVSLPSDFSHVLDRDPETKHLFDRLSYSRKQGLVQPIEQAKTAETRQRRIDKAITALREGRA
jgi:hypothetical protein